eukprot:CAMPEP_0206229520 /NCGR_PEP_ID=MMETSP0047_2-20121206/9749_1 /ASSEMBLY_ACC=CAM_ASM_000192 /TAXON_ID=195065 /ORGANISM="Chroomonas mesostigmatica_cf, Strain CCMP1168" /LENGTH=213 /DNA_ID=CAMNT_0053652841 /DNA_START=542 /DNA_END=1180 /DNA_ORIENTATION=-
MHNINRHVKNHAPTLHHPHDLSVGGDREDTARGDEALCGGGGELAVTCVGEPVDDPAHTRVPPRRDDRGINPTRTRRDRIRSPVPLSAGDLERQAEEDEGCGVFAGRVGGCVCPALHRHAHRAPRPRAPRARACVRQRVDLSAVALIRVARVQQIRGGDSTVPLLARDHHPPLRLQVLRASEIPVRNHVLPHRRLIVPTLKVRGHTTHASLRR